MFGARCVSKCRTPKVPKSLSPQFQHIATFDQQDIAGYDALQAIVWADYGPLDNKAFMGVAQVQVRPRPTSNLRLAQIDEKDKSKCFHFSFRLWIFRLDQLRAGIVFFHRHQLLTPLYQVVNKAQI